MKNQALFSSKDKMSSAEVFVWCFKLAESRRNEKMGIFIFQGYREVNP